MHLYNDRNYQMNPIKKILTLLLLAIAQLATAATLVPIQLLNPAGSTSGQFITSTGASSAPAWATVTLSGLGGLAVANNLSDVASAPSARTNLGLGTAATQNTGTSGAVVPLLNGSNAWSGAQTFSALITPSSTIGIKGTATNDNAQAGSAGESSEEYVQAGPTSIASLTNVNAASVTVAAGDYEVWCTALFALAGVTGPNSVIVSVNSTSITFGPTGTYTQFQWTLAAGNQTIPAPRRIFKLASSTTLYCVAQTTYISGSPTVTGTLWWRRMR